MDGTYKVDTFEYQPPDDEGREKKRPAAHSMEGVYDEIRSLVAGNFARLREAFLTVAPDEENPLVTVGEWARVMGQVLELQEIERDLVQLQPVLAPAADEDEDTDMIDWRSFLDNNRGTFAMSSSMDAHNAEVLHQNHDMLLSIFNYLDYNGTGTIDLEEFQRGVGFLNKRLPLDRQILKPESLFRRLDLDGNGEIVFDEFKNFFSML